MFVLTCTSQVWTFSLASCLRAGLDTQDTSSGRSTAHTDARFYAAVTRGPRGTCNTEIVLVSKPPMPPGCEAARGTFVSK